MPLSLEHFARTLGGLQALLPFAKQLPEEALLLAWEAFPEQAKRELTNEAWTWAAGRLLRDPAPQRELPLPEQLRLYLYRLENTGGGLTIGPAPLEWRLRVDPHNLPASDAQLQLRGTSEGHREPRHAPDGVLAQLGWNP